MLEKLKRAVNGFNRVQDKYDDFGAADSEPDGIFQYAIATAYNKGENILKDTGEFWQLYTHSMNCERAAKALYRSAKVAVDIVLNAKISDRKELHEYLSSNMWRVEIYG